MCTRTAANAWFRSRTLLLNHGLESWLPIAPSGFTWWSEPFALCGEQISGFENQKWLNCHNTSNTHGHTCEQLHAVRLSPFCSHTTLLEPSSTSPVPNRLPSHIAVRAYSSWAAAFLRSKDSRSPEVIPRSKDARSTEVILRSKDGRSAEVNPRSKDARSTDVRRPSSYTEQARQKWGSPAEQRRGLLLGTLLKTIKVDANLQVGGARSHQIGNCVNSTCCFWIRLTTR